MDRGAFPSLLLVLAAVMAGLARPGPVTGAATGSHRHRVDAGAPVSCREQLEAVLDIDRDAGLSVIIATAPDPKASGLPSAFDLELDAIQRAISHVGYSLERFWLPWDGREASGGPCESNLPGVLVARSAGQPDGGLPGVQLIVLVVGEVPTAGINHDQFVTACERVEELTRRNPCTEAYLADAGFLGVLGPTFSGSARSLQALLDGNGVPIRSGTATADSLGQQLGQPDGSFQRTVLPDGLVKREMLRFLKRSAGAHRHTDVALLVESNTVYGQSFRSGDGVRFEVPFPLHVHRLQRSVEGQVPGGLQVDPAALPLPILPDDDPGRSAISQYSHTTQSYDERVLETALLSLARENIRFIGILATDDQDKLYLATRTRAFCPNATLFTFESSLLLTHPDYARVMDGMLVASTYPLIPYNQSWTPSDADGGDPRRIQFASSSAEGQFNAMLALLTHDRGPFLEYGPPFPSNGELPEARTPPVWITVVGNGGMWPVDVEPLVPGSPSGVLQWRSGGAETRRLSTPWGVTLAFWAATVWALLRVISFWSTRKAAEISYASANEDANKTEKKKAANGDSPFFRRAISLLGDVPTAAAIAGEGGKRGHTRAWWAARRERLLWAVAGLFGFVMSGYGGVATLVLLRLGQPGGNRTHVWIVGVAVLATLAALAFTTITCVIQALRRGGWRRNRMGSAAGLALVLFELFLAGVGFFVVRRGVHGLLASERLIALASGVSLVMPLFIGWLAGYLAIRTYIWSLTHAPLVLHAEPDKQEPPPAFGFIKQLCKPVLEQDYIGLERPFWQRHHWMTCAGIFLIPFFFLSLVHEAPVDGWRASTLLTFAAYLIVTTCAWALDRVVEGSRMLERMLRLFRSGPHTESLKTFFATLPPKHFGRLQALQPTIRNLAEAFGKLPRTSASGMEDELQRDLNFFQGSPAWGSSSFDTLREHAEKNLGPPNAPPGPAHVELGVVGTMTFRRSEGSAHCLDEHGIAVVGWYFVFLVSWALNAIRMYLVLAAILAASAFLLFVTYPQSPRHLLLTGAWVLMAGCLVVGIAVLFRLERNETLSEMSGTKAGSVTFDPAVLKTIGTLIAGPVLAVVALEFPQLGRWLAEWAQPLLRTLK